GPPRGSLPCGTKFLIPMVEMSRPGHLCKELTRVKHSGAMHVAGQFLKQRLSPDPPGPHMPLVHSSIPMTPIFQQLQYNAEMSALLPRAFFSFLLPFQYLCLFTSPRHLLSCHPAVHLAQQGDVCPCCRSPLCYSADFPHRR
uniref:Uncharacterized protein n=1 Tax=Coturnix japonica TaxID=93934 RepID=A0A8C2TAJ1_COTJA